MKDRNFYVEKNKGGVRKEECSLNGFKKYIIFDSGSTLNIISTKSLKSIKHIKSKIINEEKHVYLLNGDSVKFSRKVLLKLEFKQRILDTYFHILENDEYMCLIGNENIISLSSSKCRIVKKFQIECKIPCKDGEIISWDRSIRNWKDKKDFQVLVIS
ncbi:hypothetical protein DMUE_5637 [Dictyocoela muelleri]|nr:hypothetical protein DMUE_5637 [Dictyocoela muelleri]